MYSRDGWIAGGAATSVGEAVGPGDGADCVAGFSDSLVERYLAVVILVFLAPLLATIAGVIALAGQRPLFRQARVGKDGVLFTICKFRTMPVLDPHARVGGLSSLRLRAFGRMAAVLRATGLDELPQLWNIARGDMAFIGPRPLTVADFEALPPGRDLRTCARPGVTGLAQVNGGQKLGAESKLAFDIYYIQRRSVGLKIYIAALTVARLFGGNALTDRTDQMILVKATGGRR